MPAEYRMRTTQSDSSQVPVGARLAKACNRCQARKIKCDGALPRCGPCSKTGLEDCNIEECVLWTQQHVAQLEERIEWLHGLVAHTYEAGEWIGGVKTGTILQPKPIKEYASEPLVEEVGLLSLRANGSYIGSMSGVTLTRLICTALRLEEQDEPIITVEDVPVRSTLSRAPYPPRSLAVEYITRYTQRIHRWYPFLDLNHLAETLSSVYDRGTQPDDFGRFTLNMIFALSSPIPPDQYTPAEYFRAALGLMTAILAQGSYDTVRVLLLLCLYGLRSWETPGVNCWQIIGHATRIGIELGLHRHRYRGGSEEIENESRRKLWWSTYSLERLIASGCCRVLSIPIDQYAPRDSVLMVPPALQPFLRAEAWQIDLRPSLHLIEQRSLLGEVLECVYTTRPRDRPSPPIAETSARVMQIQARLVTWAQTTPLVVQTDTIEHDVLQLAFHQATVLLHRPSPSFPNPAPDVLDVCLGAARRTIHVGQVFK
ncbi:hypothetical protein TREMEDRAFT_64398 [Tremella mesenterica DSM 1558]|uniref:uncharacterized protein n=1 Tax=Tremella mesenterica (strain ATCC 24925 / CBS 8224 / DSM 1558 / NBRC 9311 / NRRL Y-6157 / RJB 2259-6 / UBC 559-6) TaxID=578456 RepID=UPI0003F4A360|nr:uncharacterized protein TREMEDRAFT_64398 [Tremella mesenterica DSM 1558]EIW67158.1 hypothetical protein TREMEDRAFT_64398 [Tremella mesenterica DSM 1558]